MSAREEVAEAVDSWGWEALQSPQRGEMIYRRGGLLIFAQYDRQGVLRSATLRRMIAANLTTEVAVVGWRDGPKVWHVTKWMQEYGQRQRARR